ncbi:hypothetical protein V7S43_014616 [Phytophthora oleae]|uniref:Uncharacterized protein n=1 Tax=Phytophthora oleae TaxID=2107226 RepID=A0ABD3F133_9STRA
MELPEHYKFHDFYLPNNLFTEKGNVRRGSKLAQLRNAHVKANTEHEESTEQGGSTEQEEAKEQEKPTGVGESKENEAPTEQGANRARERL